MHHIDQLKDVSDRSRQHLAVLEQLAYLTCVARKVGLRNGIAIDFAGPYPPHVPSCQATLEFFAADLFGEVHPLTLVKVEADQQEQRSVAAKADD
jgi:hypothetical protein